MQQKESKTNSHFWISIIKSIIRFGACYFLFNGDFKSSALLFVFAEGLGIAEDENNRKTDQQLRHGSVQRIEFSNSSNGNRKSVYSPVSKWLRG